MLVVSRSPGESIQVGSDIVVTVLSSRRVRIGIDAPDGVLVLRSELLTGDEFTEKSPENESEETPE